MRTLALLAATLLAVPVCGTMAQPVSTGTFELRVSGGFLGPAFVVTVSESGVLVVTRTDRAATVPETSQKQLPPSDQREIMLLASQNTDFSSDCDHAVPDGTNASLRVRSPGKSVDRQVALCGAWPSGKQTIRLLSAINRHLPFNMLVFQAGP